MKIRRPNQDISNTPRSQFEQRRFILKACAGLATTLVYPQSLMAAKPTGERKLAFYNTHTGEETRATYWVEGEYVQEGLIDLHKVLRDHRTGEVYPIDPQLLDLLHGLQHRVDHYKPFSIISGYRSPKTNAMLNKKSNGVAKRSLHMQGKAIDIRLPGVDLKHLRKAALAMKAGGVGYYPASDFIHVDTGRVRFW